MTLREGVAAVLALAFAYGFAYWLVGVYPLRPRK